MLHDFPPPGYEERIALWVVRSALLATQLCQEHKALDLLLHAVIAQRVIYPFQSLRNRDRR
jgi:hypothetical protein